MRILTLLAGKDVLPEAVRLSEEIRTFNAEIDFRLRFLHVEIEEIFAAAPGLLAPLRETVARAEVREVPATEPLEAAARLALLLDRERPELMVVAGLGTLLAPGVAAARACGVKLAFFGHARGEDEGALDLGENPPEAVERLTGVAREIR